MGSIITRPTKVLYIKYLIARGVEIINYTQMWLKDIPDAEWMASFRSL